MKTHIAKEKDIQRTWHVIDAKDQILGRLSAKVASLLLGKHKVIFAPHQDTGDFVVVINARKVKLTGKKMAVNTHKRYSAYPGGLNQDTLETVMKKKPENIIIHAVHGMLPKTKLGAKLLGKLKVYPDEKHPHQSQKPKELKLA